MSIDSYINRQNDSVRTIMEALRFLIMQSAPGIREKMAFGIPFFYARKNLCYLNPYQKSKVDLCFYRGVDLSNESGLLESRERKQVRSMVIESIQDLKEKEEVIRYTLQEALMVDELRNRK